MNPTTLILGASGRIGSRIATEIADRGHDVRRATRRPSAPDEVSFDWNDRSTWRPVLGGANRVFLMTPETGCHLGQQGSEFTGLASEVGVEHIVLLSALGVDSTPDMTGMAEIEDAVTEFASHTILRPNTFMQNFTTGAFAGPIIERDAVVAPVGAAAVSFIDANDIARCASLELGDEPTGGTLTLTGGEAITFGEAADTISEATRRPIAYTNPEPEEMREMLSAAGTPPPVLEMILGFYATLASGAHAVIESTVEDITGCAATTFHDFCEANATSWRAA